MSNQISIDRERSLGVIPYEDADIVTCSEEYARRFDGPVGKWMLEVQENALMELIKGHEGATVLDIGGGHGQVALPLARAGFKVTVLGSAVECRDRIKSEVDSGLLRFDVGNPLDLPYPDESFDTVVCFRLVSHCLSWDKLIAEMCRVAKRAVIIDYPTYRSLNLFSQLLFPLKRRIEGNTRPFAVFLDRDVITQLRAAAPGQYRRRAQFFLPMVIHRSLSNLRFSHSLEYFFRRVGLTGLLGSPIVLEWTKQL